MPILRDRSSWLYGPATPCRDGPPPEMRDPKRLILLGAPGAGKGTLAAGLLSSFGACPLSTGDVFRAAPSRHPEDLTPALRTAVGAMKRGELVTDSVVLELVKERSKCLRCRGGFILDGFPRTVVQADALDELLHSLGVALTAVICLEMAPEGVINRLSGRRTCPVCKAVYHVANNPPKKPDLCDLCQVNLVQREDDRPEAIRVRLAVYEKSTMPLIQYYERQKLLLRIPADGTPDDTVQRTLDALTLRSVHAG